MEMRKIFIVRIDFTHDGDLRLYKVMSSLSGVGNVKSRMRRMISPLCSFKIISTFDDKSCDYTSHETHHGLNEIKKRLHKGGCVILLNGMIKAPDDFADGKIIELVMG